MTIKRNIAAICILLGVGIAVLPVPASAAVWCNSTSTDRARQQQLSDELQLQNNLSASVDIWNGCLKVTSVQNGHFVTQFYDPDTLRSID